VIDALRPLIVQLFGGLVEPDELVEQVAPPGVRVALYEVMLLPPVLVGVAHEMVPVARPPVAATMLGAEGTAGALGGAGIVPVTMLRSLMLSGIDPSVSQVEAVVDDAAEAELGAVAEVVMRRPWPL
jgi:hypothetical protein